MTLAGSLKFYKHHIGRSTSTLASVLSVALGGGGGGTLDRI